MTPQEKRAMDTLGVALSRLQMAWADLEEALLSIPRRGQLAQQANDVIQKVKQGA